MKLPTTTTLRHAWNIFTGQEDLEEYKGFNQNSNFSILPSSRRISYTGSEKSIVTAVYNRIAMDVAAYDFLHVYTDKEGRYLETIDSGLNNCLTIEANKDQTGRSLIQDIVMTMFQDGAVAIVPVDTILPPKPSGAYEILSLRAAKIIEWYPDQVKIEIYNDQTGVMTQLKMPKRLIGIVQNPLYSVMNEPNSTMKRLIRKLGLLDIIDEDGASGKLDLIIQLPYLIKSEKKQIQAEMRRKDLESQLASSKYGIVYTDGTERITQLNRPTENKLLEQVTYLTNMLYSQLGITEDVFNGKASEPAMTNYYDRSIEPIVKAIVEEMRRKFLTKTARSQHQTIMGFRDVFTLIPATEIAKIADVLSRNQIMTANEFRSVLKLKPSKDPKADELQNRNMPVAETNSSEVPIPT